MRDTCNMASIIDYMLDADKNRADARLVNSQANLAPYTLAQSASRNNYYDALASTMGVRYAPPVNKQQMYQNLQNLGYPSNSIAAMSPQQGAQIVQQQIRYGQNLPNQPQEQQGSQFQSSVPKVSAIANYESGQTGSKLAKDTYTTTNLNQIASGRNSETTLNQIKSIAPSIAQEGAGLSGILSRAHGAALSFFGENPGATYNDWNTFNSSLKLQMVNQLRQFYGSSIQPHQIDKIIEEISPKIGENPRQYLFRLNEVEKNLNAELKARQQNLQTSITSPGLPLSVENSSQSQDGDFYKLLAEEKARRGIK